MPKLIKLTDLISKFFYVFPDAYWSKVLDLRLTEENEMTNVATSIFSDIFQPVHKPDPENKTTRVLIFCTVPKVSECWDTVLAFYCILLYHKFGFKYSPSQVANLILEVLVVGLKDKLKGLYHPENIENFDRTVLEYLMQTKEGTRTNKFFTDPEGTLTNILGVIEELGIRAGSCKKGFYDKARESAKEILNKPEIKSDLQEEINQLFNEH